MDKKVREYVLIPFHSGYLFKVVLAKKEYQEAVLKLVLIPFHSGYLFKEVIKRNNKGGMKNEMS